MTEAANDDELSRIGGELIVNVRVEMDKAGCPGTLKDVVLGMLRAWERSELADKSS